MSDHLIQTQIDNYSRRKLPAAELLSVTDHLAVCDECRLRVEIALDGDAAFFAVRADVFNTATEARIFTAEQAHLTFERTAEYLDGTLADEELRSVADHLSACEQCVAAVEDLRAFKTQIAPELNREYQPKSTRASVEGRRRRLLKATSFFPQRSPAFVFVSALAILLLTIAGWMAWQTLHRKEAKQDVSAITPSPTILAVASPALTPSIAPLASPEGPAAAIVARLNDGENQVTLDQEGKLSGAENLPNAYQQLIKQALTQQRLEKSPLLAGLARPGSSLMNGGGGQDNQFSVIEPVGKVTLTNRPTFHWSRLEGASGYVVEVYDERFNLAATSSSLGDISWTLPHSLPRGGIYSWQVKAIKDGQEFISPRPPAPQAKFRILDQAKANELAQARRAYTSSRLTLGLLYAQAGLLDDAERELRALQKANPNSTIVRQWLADAQAMRR